MGGTKGADDILATKKQKRDLKRRGWKRWIEEREREKSDRVEQEHV